MAAGGEPQAGLGASHVSPLQFVPGVDAVDELHQPGAKAFVVLMGEGVR